MKKILQIIIIFTCLFFCFFDVKAIEDKGDKEIKDTSKLAAKCVYDGNEGIKGKWYVYIDKQYNVTVFSPDVTYGKIKYTVLYYVSSEIDFNHEIFLDENQNLSCDKVPHIYIKDSDASDAEKGCNTDGTQCHRYSITTKSKEYYKKKTLVSGESKVYSSNPAEESVESGDWDLVCNYGSVYLNYNSKEYATNAKGFHTYETISNLIVENKQSCPTTYCKYTRSSGMVEIEFEYFTNVYETYDGCVVSSQYGAEYSCGILNTEMKQYHESVEKKDSSEIKKTREEIQSFCSIAFSNLNYTDPNKCIVECLEVIDIITNDDYGDNSQCGFSGKLIQWIANIVKWLKYIIPVLVIVLGILDFIKAIANEKEDEMKKAQGHFVKRLIAAGLIFIVPFIIEFILDKMGFAANGCGIIDL